MKPSLAYPFPSRIHPDAGLLEEKASQIIAAYSPETIRERLRKLKAGYRAAAGWPDGTTEQLSLVTRWLLWGFAFDNHYGPQPLESLSEACARTMDLLRGEPVTPRDPDILRQIALVREEVAPYVSSGWMARFRYDHTLFFEGLMMDAAYSQPVKMRYPPLREYIGIRVRVMHAPAITDLIEIASGAVLPDDVFHHPYIQQIRTVACEMMGWMSDLFALEKAIKNEAALNLVLILRHEKKCTLETAFEEAIRMHDAHLDTFVKLRADLPDFGIHQVVAERYVNGLALWLHGHMEWINHTRSV